MPTTGLSWRKINHHHHHHHQLESSLIASFILTMKTFRGKIFVDDDRRCNCTVQYSVRIWVSSVLSCSKGIMNNSFTDYPELVLPYYGLALQIFS